MAIILMATVVEDSVTVVVGLGEGDSVKVVVVLVTVEGDPEEGMGSVVKVAVDLGMEVADLVREGVGSVVETHATPMSEGRTAVVELTYATSERWGFAVVARAQKVLRPVMRWAAHRLWVEDAAYAERLFELRAGARAAGDAAVEEPVRLIAR